MRGVQISHLIDHREYIPQLGQWLFEQWDSIFGEKTPDARIKKLKTHMNRDKLPIAWVAHANGQLLGTAALRVHDLEGREDLTPWLGGVFVGSHFRHKQAWYSRLGWSILGPCVWQQRPGDIMCKQLQTA